VETRAGARVSYTDVGKDAKRKGKMHPKHAQVPPDAPTPAAVRKAKSVKNFGLRYESSFFGGKWMPTRRWFKTEAHRDQAFDKEAAYQARWHGNGILRFRELQTMERR
jgi:hypothetical protein